MSKTWYADDDVRRGSIYRVVKSEAHACVDSRPFFKAESQNSNLSFFLLELEDEVSC